MSAEFFNNETYGPLIDGIFHTKGREAIPHHSIAKKKPWKKLCLASETDTQTALAVSARSFSLSNYERSAILQKLAHLLLEHEKRVAEWITLEMGKTIRDALAEVAYAASYFQWFAEEAKRIYGYTVPSTKGDKRIEVRYEPVGTVAIITPWNFPIAMAARKIGPAFAAGCSSIVRPSTDTCLSMLAIGALAIEAGFPKEALQILPGDPELISRLLLSDSRVRKLTFTGSTSVGEKLYGQCVSTFKKVTMELGGHAPLIVFEDADLDKAVEETINTKLRVSGQTCVCANRIYLQNSIRDAFLSKLTKRLKMMHIGDPLDPATDLTDVLHPTSEKKVPAQIQDAVQKGASLHFGGKGSHEPTILVDVTSDMLISHEETFGPVFPIFSFQTEEEALQMANDTPYGLAAYVFTRDINRAERTCAALDYGIIGLNDGLPTTAQAPFGGVKDSGFGREGGPSGIFEYLVEKTISMKYD